MSIDDVKRIAEVIIENVHIFLEAVRQEGIPSVGLDCIGWTLGDSKATLIRQEPVIPFCTDAI